MSFCILLIKFNLSAKWNQYRYKTAINFQYIYQIAFWLLEEFHSFPGTKQMTDSNRLRLCLI